MTGVQTCALPICVVIAVGVTSNNLLEEEVKEIADVYVIGDAKAPRTVMNAIYEANEVARSLFRKAGEDQSPIHDPHDLCLV